MKENMDTLEAREAELASAPRERDNHPPACPS